LALDGSGQFVEKLGVFKETVSLKLNILDVPSELKYVPQG
jgi:hypothetical protein